MNKNYINNLPNTSFNSILNQTDLSFQIYTKPQDEQNMSSQTLMENACLDYFQIQGKMFLDHLIMVYDQVSREQLKSHIKQVKKGRTSFEIMYNYVSGILNNMFQQTKGEYFREFLKDLVDNFKINRFFNDTYLPWIKERKVSFTTYIGLAIEKKKYIPMVSQESMKNMKTKDHILNIQNNINKIERQVKLYSKKLIEQSKNNYTDLLEEYQKKQKEKQINEQEDYLQKQQQQLYQQQLKQQQLFQQQQYLLQQQQLLQQNSNIQQQLQNQNQSQISHNSFQESELSDSRMCDASANLDSFQSSRKGDISQLNHTSHILNESGLSEQNSFFNSRIVQSQQKQDAEQQGVFASIISTTNSNNSNNYVSPDDPILDLQIQNFEKIHKKEFISFVKQGNNSFQENSLENLSSNNFKEYMLKIFIQISQGGSQSLSLEIKDQIKNTLLITQKIDQYMQKCIQNNSNKQSPDFINSQKELWKIQQNQQQNQNNVLSQYNSKIIQDFLNQLQTDHIDNSRYYDSKIIQSSQKQDVEQKGILNSIKSTSTDNNNNSVCVDPIFNQQFQSFLKSNGDDFVNFAIQNNIDIEEGSFVDSKLRDSMNQQNTILKSLVQSSSKGSQNTQNLSLKDQLQWQNSLQTSEKIQQLKQKCMQSKSNKSSPDYIVSYSQLQKIQKDQEQYQDNLISKYNSKNIQDILNCLENDDDDDNNSTQPGTQLSIEQANTQENIENQMISNTSNVSYNRFEKHIPPQIPQNNNISLFEQSSSSNVNLSNITDTSILPIPPNFNNSKNTSFNTTVNNTINNQSYSLNQSHSTQSTQQYYNQPPSQQNMSKLQEHSTLDPTSNGKTLLQELIQKYEKNSQKKPDYITQQIGPSHIPKFFCTVTYLSYQGTGEGSNKKDAEKQAANNVYDRIFQHYKILEQQQQKLLNEQEYLLVSKNIKGQLQEYIQKRYPGQDLPTYQLVAQQGTEHQPTFQSRVFWKGHEFIGNGKSKKDSEAQAAQKLLKELQNFA